MSFLLWKLRATLEVAPKTMKFTVGTQIESGGRKRVAWPMVLLWDITSHFLTVTS